MKTIRELLILREQAKPKGGSERGDLLKFFRERLLDKNSKPYSYPYLGMRLAHLSVSDLYYLRSICLDTERRGGSFGKCFWGSIKSVKGAGDK